MTKFLQYLESSGKFRKTFFSKYTKYYRYNICAFHYIMYTTEVIAF